MTQSTPTQLRMADLATRKPTHFQLEPDAAARADLARALGIVEIRKLRFVGEIAPMGRRDWQLKADLGATVVQDCVVTLDPVVTRIDETTARTYSATYEAPEAGEIEMPEDDSVDPVPDVLDLTAVMAEALSLALPSFPRSENAELGSAQFSAEDVTPMTDDDAKPFAGLGALRDQLKKAPDQ